MLGLPRLCCVTHIVEIRVEAGMKQEEEDIPLSSRVVIFLLESLIPRVLMI